jgi:hypothetical protein
MNRSPSPIQIARGASLVKSVNRNQLGFLEDFVIENSVMTVGGYNYSVSGDNQPSLGIPNIPLDADAFAETALAILGV